MDVILAIAALCSIHSSSSNADRISVYQADCQKYYSKCYKDAPDGNRSEVLSKCIRDRKYD